MKESHIPTLIREQFAELGELKSAIDAAKLRTEAAQLLAVNEQQNSGKLRKKKEMIKSLKKVMKYLLEAQSSVAEQQKLILEYKKKLEQFIKYWFSLGIKNIEMNRSIVCELKILLDEETDEELDELDRQEILGVIGQLNAQENIMKRQEELAGHMKQYESRFKELDRQSEEQARLLTEQEERNKKQFHLITEQMKRDGEHERLFQFIKESDVNIMSIEKQLETQAAELDELSKAFELDRSNEENQAKRRKALSDELKAMKAETTEVFTIIDARINRAMILSGLSVAVSLIAIIVTVLRGIL